LELTPVGSPATERYNKISYSTEALDTLLIDLFLEAHPRAPQQIVLDLDATDTPLHGRQEARFFHGYYGHYCYLPLYVFCGDQLDFKFPCTPQTRSCPLRPTCSDGQLLMCGENVSVDKSV
jgi:hypothetical protein